MPYGLFLGADECFSETARRHRSKPRAVNQGRKRGVTQRPVPRGRSLLLRTVARTSLRQAARSLDDRCRTRQNPLGIGPQGPCEPWRG